MSPIIIYIATVLIAGGSGFYISYRFNQSDYAATNRSGDFGSPRGGIFATMSGMLIGMIVVNFASRLAFFPAEAAGIAFMIALIVGMVSGLAGMFLGLKKRGQRQDKDTEEK